MVSFSAIRADTHVDIPAYSEPQEGAEKLKPRAPVFPSSVPLRKPGHTCPWTVVHVRRKIWVHGDGSRLDALVPSCASWGARPQDIALLRGSSPGRLQENDHSLSPTGARVYGELLALLSKLNVHDMICKGGPLQITQKTPNRGLRLARPSSRVATWYV